MMVKFKNKIWKLECPKELRFPKGCIRNILISRGQKKTITNLNDVNLIRGQKTLF